MKTHKKLFILTICLLALSMTGCASRVVTDKTTFYKPDYQSRGKIAVMAADQRVNQSLEFVRYKSGFKRHLGKIGFTTVEDTARADYLAIISYGIDNGKTAVTTNPIYGHTGGGTTYNSGTLYSGGSQVSYSGSSYTTPTYGVVGSYNSTHTSYTRNIAMDIVAARDYLQGNKNVLLEARAKSTGSCSQLTEVFDEMLVAMFDEFPGENGRSKRISINGDFNC